MAAEDGVLQVYILADQEKVLHSRKVYSILNFLGDIGGIFEILVIIFGALIYAIQNFTFVI